MAGIQPLAPQSRRRLLDGESDALVHRQNQSIALTRGKARWIVQMRSHHTRTRQFDMDFASLQPIHRRIHCKILGVDQRYLNAIPLCRSAQRLHKTGRTTLDSCRPPDSACQQVGNANIPIIRRHAHLKSLGTYCFRSHWPTATQNIAQPCNGNIEQSHKNGPLARKPWLNAYDTWRDGKVDRTRLSHFNRNWRIIPIGYLPVSPSGHHGSRNRPAS